MIQNFDSLLLPHLLLTAFLAVAVIFLAVKLRRLDKVRKQFFSTGLKKDLEQVLVDQNRFITTLNEELKNTEKNLAGLTEANKNNFKKMGFVRFNPFEDAGGNISFALALMDDHNDGIIISSLHGREGTRIYAKQVKKGRSTTKLTDEEMLAIKQAL